MSPRGENLDLRSYDNQYGNGYSRRGTMTRRHYEGDLPAYENQYGSGGRRNKFKNVSFFSKRLNRRVNFKAKVVKTKRRRRKNHVKRSRR